MRQTLPPQLALYNQFAVLADDMAAISTPGGLGVVQHDPSSTMSVLMFGPPTGAESSDIWGPKTADAAAPSSSSRSRMRERSTKTSQMVRGDTVPTHWRIKLLQDAVASRSFGLQDQPPLVQPGTPLFRPTTLIVHDSRTRNNRYINAITSCFPGAKVKDLLQKLPDVLPSLPTSIIWIVVHIGTNDTKRQQSEVTKTELREPFIR